MLRSVFKNHFGHHRLYFCNFNLRKTVKSQLNGISQRASFKDKTMRVIRRLINLTTISNAKLMKDELAGCKAMLEQVPEEQENAKDLHNVK